MNLHHYTTVNTLALMLRHQTLRFTRLDQFDDVTEGRSINTFPYGARMFASCWSAAEEESIPQWAMYGDAMRGIRLSIKHDPFIWHPININWHNNFQFIDLEAPYNLEEMLSPGITLIPTPKMKELLGQPIRYVSDVPSAISGLYTNTSSDDLTLYGEGTEIAFLKSNDWAFQQEFRYVLTASPGPSKGYSGNYQDYIEERRQWYRLVGDPLKGIPSRTYIDLKLAKEALVEAEITVGPLAPAGTLEIVESLVARFAVGATVKSSCLSGTIRAK